MLRRQKVLGHDKQMEALELRNKQLMEYIEGLERDLAGRMAEQVLLNHVFSCLKQFSLECQK